MQINSINDRKISLFYVSNRILQQDNSSLVDRTRTCTSLIRLRFRHRYRFCYEAFGYIRGQDCQQICTPSISVLNDYGHFRRNCTLTVVLDTRPDPIRKYPTLENNWPESTRPKHLTRCRFTNISLAGQHFLICLQSSP